MPRDLASLRQLRTAAIGKMEALQAKGDTLSAEDQTAFDAAAGEVEAIDKAIANAQKLSALKASTAITSPESQDDATAEGAAGASQADANDPRRLEPAARTKPETGILFAQTVRALVVGGGDVAAAAQFASKTWGERYEVTGALQANDASAGGFLVPGHYSAELITLLRPKTIVRRNARVVPLVGGKDTMPTIESGSAAYYIGEGSDIQTSEPTFGSLTFVEREIAALVPISNKLLRHGAVNVDYLVRDDMVQSFAQAEDAAFMRGDGVGAAPKGLRYLAGFTVDANDTVNVANIDADARKLINALVLNNIPMTNVRWTMSPRVFGFLQDLRDANGNPVYPSLSLDSPTWKGFPVEQSTAIPINLGAGTGSEVGLVDFGEAVIADTFQVRIDVSDSASYKVGNSMVSAYSRNQTLIRAVAAHDFGLRRKYAAGFLTDVTWGG